MLYRYCAKVGVIDPMKMLDVAYHTLIGVIQEEPHMINYTDDPDRMVNVIYNQVKEFIPDGISSLKYEGKDADILVSNNTISIVPKAYDADFCHDMVPDYLSCGTIFRCGSLPSFAYRQAESQVDTALQAHLGRCLKQHHQYKQTS